MVVSYEVLIFLFQVAVVSGLPFLGAYIQDAWPPSGIISG